MLASFGEATRTWFEAAFAAPTPAQVGAWAAISAGRNALVVAPTGSGKTLSAFLWSLDRLAAAPVPEEKQHRCRVLYVSPLKALAVDVERNLRAPLTGIRHTADAARGCPSPTSRSASAPATPRPTSAGALATTPPDILITTPESLFLMLTSQAREALRGVETVIVDEVHAVAGTKRGAHLALSLERLDALLDQPAQRIGLSATVRPIEEVARFLGGSHPVEVVAPGVRRRSGTSRSSSPSRTWASSAPTGRPTGGARGVRGRRAERRASIWPHVEERVVDLDRAAPLDDRLRQLPPPRRAPHRPLQRDRRRARRGRAPGSTTAAGRVAVRRPGRSQPGPPAQVMAQSGQSDGAPHGHRPRPPRLGLQGAAGAHRGRPQARPAALRGGHLQPRARHRHGRGRPGRADRVAAERRLAPCSGSAAPATRSARCPAACCCPSTAPTSCTPRSPSSGCAPGAIESLRVPGQPARRAGPAGRGRDRRSTSGTSTSCSTWSGGRRRTPPCRAAPTTRRSTCSRAATPATSSPSCARASSGTGSPARSPAGPGAQRLAVTSGGTIPDRGLFGVFLVGEKASRVGELDEEMVYESRVGDVFALGATSWRIEDITHDRVLVSPAPGQPGRLPFWKGDQLGRPAELGAAIGAFTRELGALDRDDGGGALPRRRPRRVGRGQPGRVPRRAARGDHASCPPTARCWSSGSATSSATGGWCCTRRSARRCTRRGRWRSAPGWPSATASTPRRCPPTTASCCASPRPTRTRRAPRCVVFEPDEIEDARHRRGRRLGAVRLPVPRVRGPGAAAAPPRPRPPLAAVAAAAAVGPAARRSRRSTRPSRSCSRRCASACRTCTTSRRWSALMTRPVLARGPGRRGRHRAAVAVRPVAAVRLRRGVHVRGRQPAGRAPRGRALPRPGAARRAAGPRRAARAARPGGARRARGGAAAARPRTARRATPRAWPTCSGCSAR